MMKELRQYTCDRCKFTDTIEAKDPGITSALIYQLTYGWGSTEEFRRPPTATRDLCGPCCKIVCTAVDAAFEQAMLPPWRDPDEA